MERIYDDEFIEVDENEILTGDEGLRIQIPGGETQEKKEIEKGVKETSKNTQEVSEDEEDLLEVDDEILNPTTTEETDTTGIRAVQEQEDTDVETDDDIEEAEETRIENEFSAFGSSLAEDGFFPDLDEEEINSISNKEELSGLLVKQLNTTLNQWKENYVNDLANNLIRDGVFTPEQAKGAIAVSYTEDQIREDLDIAKNVIRKYYKRVGTPDKEIERIINSREDLEESAVELNELNNQAELKEKAAIAERVKTEEANKTKLRQEFLDTLKKNTFEYSEFIPGKKLKASDKEEVYMNIEPVLQKINTNLTKYAPMLAYLDKYGILEGKFDKLISTGKTQGISDLERILREKKRGDGKTTSSRRTNGPLIDDTGVRSIYK